MTSEANPSKAPAPHFLQPHLLHNRDS